MMSRRDWCIETYRYFRDYISAQFVEFDEKGLKSPLAARSAYAFTPCACLGEIAWMLTITAN